MGEHIEHRRADDRELLGWIRPRGERFAAVDLLGRVVAEDVDWLAAEEALDDRGLSYLAEPFVLRLPDGTDQRVRLSQLSADGVTVVDDDWGAAAAVGGAMTVRRLPFPAPRELRELRWPALARGRTRRREPGPWGDRALVVSRCDVRPRGRPRRRPARRRPRAGGPAPGTRRST